MKALRIFYTLMRGGAAKPGEAQYAQVLKLRELLRHYGYFARGVEKVTEHEGTRNSMKERVLMNWTPADVERLRKLPKDTLGFQFIDFLDKNGLKPLSYIQDPHQTDEDYYIQRVVQTHDLWHVILGYGTDEYGEIAINGFNFAQIAWPPAPFYIGGMILRQMLRAPHRVPELFDVITEGYRRGKAAKSFFAVPWEKQLERNVAELRAELQVS